MIFKHGQNFNHPAKGKAIKVEPIRQVGHIEAIKKLLGNNPRNLAMFTLGINTSLRPRELLSLKVGQVQDLKLKGEIEVREDKTGKVRKISLNKECIDSIGNLLKEKRKRKKGLYPNDLLFAGKKGPLLVPSFNSLVKKWCADINLPGNYGGQTLRKTFGYQQLVSFGTGLPELMVAFSHSSQLQTLEYLGIWAEEPTDIGPGQIVGNRQLTDEEMPRKLIEMENEIAELNQALEERRESEENFKTFFEYANDALVYIDNTGRIVEVNDVAEDMIGWSRTEAKGKHFSELGLFRPDHFGKEIIQTFDNSMEDVLRPITELEVLRKDGTAIFIEVSTKLVKKNGEAKGLMSIVRDITDRKQMEQALQKSEEMARALLNATTDAVMLLDLEGGILDINTAYADKFGKGIDDTIGLCLWNLIPFDAADLKENIDRVIRTGRSIRFEKEYQGVWMDNVVYPVLDMQGNVSWIAVFSHDITKLKEAEETLRQHRDHLEELVKDRTVNLEQTNTALKVLLRRREEDKSELEDKMVLNVKELVLPFLEDLTKSRLTNSQKALADILEYNLNDIISPFVKTLSSKYYSFTPVEIRIANLIKQGRSTKEIASHLKVSSRTVDNHRYNIRKKLGINNEKASLATHLLSIE